MTQCKFIILGLAFIFSQCSELSWYRSAIDIENKGKFSPGLVCLANQLKIVKNKDYWKNYTEFIPTEDEKIFLNRKYPTEDINKIYSLQERYKLDLTNKISTAIYLTQEALKILQKKGFTVSKKLNLVMERNNNIDPKLEDFKKVYSRIWNIYTNDSKKFEEETFNPYKNRYTSNLFPIPPMSKCRFVPSTFKYISNHKSYENLLVGENCKSYISDLKKRNFNLDMYEEIFRTETEYLLQNFQPKDIITKPIKENCDYNLDIYEVIYPGSEKPSWILYNNIFSSLTLSIYPSYYGDLNQYRFYFVLKSTNSDNKLIIHLTYAKRSLRSILFFPVLFMKEETKYFWTISKEERIELYKEAIKDLNEKLSL